MPHCLPVTNKIFVFALGTVVLAFMPTSAEEKPAYPKPPSSEQVDDYFGVKVRDRDLRRSRRRQTDAQNHRRPNRPVVASR